MEFQVSMLIGTCIFMWFCIVFNMLWALFASFCWFPSTKTFPQKLTSKYATILHISGTFFRYVKDSEYVKHQCHNFCWYENMGVLLSLLISTHNLNLCNIFIEKSH